jgi:hypothetical protein
MKQFSSLLSAMILLAGLSNSEAQVITPASQEYETAKLNGQLSSYTVVPVTGSNLPVQSASWQWSPSRANPNCDCMQTLDSTFLVVPFQGAQAPDYRNDDLSSPAISLPFTFCLYGQSFNSVYINNNGNLSFSGSVFNFTSDSFPSNNFVMAAPFWADVDTRNPNSGLVYYQLTSTHLIVRWDQVGYFPNNASSTNDFQIIITDGTDPLLPPGINVGYCYGQMEWSSGGTGWGTPATVGANEGDGVSYIQFGRFGDTTNVYDGPFGDSDGLLWLVDQQLYFNSCTDTTAPNVDPIIVSNQCDTVTLFPGDTVQYNMMILAGDPNQNTWANFSMGTFNDFTVIPLFSPGYRIYQVTINTTAALTQNLSLEVEAFDDGVPQGHYTRSYELVLDPIITGVKENEESSVRIFPNPAEDEVFIQGIKPGSNLRLNDLSGRLIKAFGAATATQQTLDLSTLSPGLYLLSITNEGKVENHKIMLR